MQINLPIDIFTYPHIPLPEVWTVEQKFATPTLTPGQIENGVRRSVAELVANANVRAGASVAVGVGSRGLDNLPLVVRTTIAELRARGLEPFILPAMGSHGGATAEGQTELLHGYGITPENVGAPIRATMEVEEMGRLEGPEAGDFPGQPVYCDRNARAADAILLINRVKPHTDFRGDIESGIGKMCAIGLGKRHGAASIHRYGTHGLRDLMPRVARYLARRLPILGGVALIENELGHTSEIHALPPDQIACDGEKALLARARAIAPRIPFPELDALLIDEMGKNISGAGMDTHVIGRGNMPSIQEETWGGPNIHIIAVLDLTVESHGNATALGLADLTTRQLIEKADWEATFINMQTSGEGGILRGRLPWIMPTGEDCVRTAIATCGQGDPSRVRLARIRSTADMQFLEITAALLEGARANPALRVSEASHPLSLSHPVRPA
jgi:hypothetical protein